MTPGLDRAASPPGQQHGKVVVRMGHAVLDGAAVHDHRVVEKAAAIRLAGLLQLLQPGREQLHVEDVDLGDLLHLVGVALVVGEVVVPFADADVGIGAVAAVVGHDEGGDPGAVGPEGQRQDIEHQFHMVGELRRHPLGTGVIGQVGADPIGRGDAALHVAHGAHVFVELVLIVAAKAAVQPLRIVEHEVEDARTPSLPPCPDLRRLVGVAAGEQPVEGQLGIDLRRHGRRCRPPGNVEGVGAAVAGIALAGELAAIGAQLQAREARVVAHLLGGPLVDRDAHPDVGALGLSGLAGGEEGGRGPGMVPRPVAVGPGLVVGETAQHREPIADRGQRLEDSRKLEGIPRLLGRPVLHHGAVGDVDEGHPQRRLTGGGGPRARRTQGPHGRSRCQERKGDRGTQAPEEGPARLMLEEAHGDWFLDGWLTGGI